MMLRPMSLQVSSADLCDTRRVCVTGGTVSYQTSELGFSEGLPLVFFVLGQLLPPYVSKSPDQLTVLVLFLGNC